ncbi:hypothetical protein [Micromonospora sp. NPDC005806]|uniref:phosphorylase family protein n=1 Tax=Micromonospora sp. NPDC005806 TaxID=3364234 RepID=UPI0036998818
MGGIDIGGAAVSRNPNEKDVLALLSLLRDEGDDDVLSIMLDDLVWSVSRMDPRFRRRVLLHAAATVGARRVGGASEQHEIFGLLDELSVLRGAVDFAVVTVKPVEFDAAKVAFGVDLMRESDHDWRGAPFYEVQVERPGRRPLKGMLTTCGDAGNSQMAAFLHTVLSVYSVRMCCLLGMAAGQNREAGLGDVVFADKVIDYGRKIVTVDGDEHELPSFTPDVSIRREMTTFSPERQGWHPMIAEHIAGAVAQIPSLRIPETFDPAEYRPRLLRKTVIAADDLIEDGSMRVRAARVGPARRTGAAEMEGAGFATGCIEEGVPWLVLRGIADLGGPDRAKDWQFVSSVAAATALRMYLTGSKLLPDKENA